MDGDVSHNFRHPDEVDRIGFTWGALALTFGPALNGAAHLSGGTVTLEPGQGHARHNHPDAEEVILVLEGTGEQMLEDEHGEPMRRPVRPGSTILVPQARYHATLNTGAAPMRIFVVYSPAGPEELLRREPDFTPLPPLHPPA